jgi:hypothetical protein
MKITLTLELDPEVILAECFEAEDGVSAEQLSQVLELMQEEGDLEDVALDALWDFISDNTHEYIGRYFNGNDEEETDEGA